MKVSVLVPTYCRPQDLARCLEALKQQTRPPDEILVIVRDSDAQTQEFLAAYKATDSSKINRVMVAEPGQVAALNAGLEAATGDILAITDDDTAPRPDWLARIEAHFASDARIGGVGGRDWVHHTTPNGDCWIEDDSQETVGKLVWWGRLIGGHHLGVGPARDVEFLKGANMSYRRAALDPADTPKIRFDAGSTLR